MPERQFDLRFICSRLMASGTRFLLHVVRYLLVLSLDYLFLDCISRLCPRKNCIIFLILPSNEACMTPICTIHRSWTWQFFHVSLLHHFTERTRKAYFMIYLTRGLSIRILFRNAFCSEGKYIRIVLIKWNRVSVSFISISID